MCHRVDLVLDDVSDERIASFIMVEDKIWRFDDFTAVTVMKAVFLGCCSV
jgi:hypothetical protein